MRSICGWRIGWRKPLWQAPSLRNSRERKKKHTHFLKWLKQSQKPVWMISGSWLYHFMFVNVCVCYNATRWQLCLDWMNLQKRYASWTVALLWRNWRNVEMEITVPGLPQFPPVYLLSSSLPLSSISFHNQNEGNRHRGHRSSASTAGPEFRDNSRRYRSRSEQKWIHLNGRITQCALFRMNYAHFISSPNTLPPLWFWAEMF